MEQKRAGAFRRLVEWWKPIAMKIGNLQVRGLLILFYFIVLSPFALVLRWANDPLGLKPGAARTWKSRVDSPDLLMERARRQF